ncbi:MAG: hypothetical protein ABW131_09465 [Candidatus Sedimenticola sp. 6PFRAG5]
MAFSREVRSSWFTWDAASFCACPISLLYIPINSRMKIRVLTSNPAAVAAIKRRFNREFIQKSMPASALIRVQNTPRYQTPGWRNKFDSNPFSGIFPDKLSVKMAAFHCCFSFDQLVI